MSSAEIRSETVTIGEPDGDWAYEFEVTFLLSHFECIWGKGCPSIKGDGTTHGCCVEGVHIVDGDMTDDLDLVVGRIAQLTPEDWQNYALAERKAETSEFGWGWRPAKEEIKTRKHRGVCIFHNRADFEGGEGCAFHGAALRRGEDPLDWKPSTCWTVPLFVDSDFERKIHSVRAVRDYDWGVAPKWWCVGEEAAYQGAQPAYVTLEAELRRTVGDAVYDELAEYLRVKLERTRRHAPLPMHQPVTTIGRSLPMHP